jgi:putative DNA methylase
MVKKSDRSVALRPVPDREAMHVTYEVVEARTASGLDFKPEFSQEGSTTCPLCGASVDREYAVAQANAGRMASELMAAVVPSAVGRGKAYLGSEVSADHLLPDEDRIFAARADLAEYGLEAPDEPIAKGGLGVRVPRYGMTSFGHLFTNRQLVMLLTLCKLVREAHQAMLDEGYEPDQASAVATYLAFVIDRVAPYHSTLSAWHSMRELTNSVFARQTLSMTWDYAEANPFGGSSGDLGLHLGSIVKVIEHCARVGQPARVIRASATDLPLEDGEFDVVITDPPYYDNVGYSDISDFFYVWLKRSIGELYPEHLGGELTPKRSEIVASPNRHDGDSEVARKFYEDMMFRAFAEARRVLKPDGILVCVYAHQTTLGWATLIEAVRRSGFVVVEAWPLDTEMPVRRRARGSAALASSIFLVARPRKDDVTGDWAHGVRPELQDIVNKRVEELPGLGVTGTDLLIATVGAGMRAYTKYARVEKPNGEELGAEEYLEEVEREVAEAVLVRIFGTDRGGLGRVDQATQFYVIARFEFGDALAPWDELNTLARGTGVELREFVDGAGSLIEFGAKRNEARLRDYRERGGEIELGRSILDHLHRVLWLAENEPLNIKDYLAVARPESDRLRLVAHALSRPGLDSSGGRGDEADACERLLGVWKRLIEDNLFTAGGA